MDGMAIVSFGVNALMGLVMYFMKMAHDNTKENIKRLEGEVKELRDTSFKKEDFRDFKQELWDRFDKLEKKVEQKQL